MFVRRFKRGAVSRLGNEPRIVGDTMMSFARSLGFFLVVFTGVPALASVTPESTLEKCQKTVKTEGAGFVARRTKAIETCFAKVAKEIVAKGAANVDGAVSTCVAALRKIENAADPTKTLTAKMTARVTARCGAGPDVLHTLGDILGTGATVSEPLAAGNLGSYCKRHGGDGAIDSLEEWLACFRAVGECASNASVAAHYPRALEWIDEIQTAMSALSPAPTDALLALSQIEQAIEGSVDDNEPQIRCGDPFLPATGQTTCWDVGTHTPTACAGTQQDGEVLAGMPLAYVDNGDGTVSDLTTGLMWEKKGDDGSIHDYNNLAITWANAFSYFINRLNNRCKNDESVDCSAGGDSDCSGVGGPCGFAGYRNWRVPNMRELASIIDYSAQSPAVKPVFHDSIACTPGCSHLTCSCTNNGAHWTSTTYVATPGSAWNMTFGQGNTGPSVKTTGMQVRAVRGGT